MFHLPTDPTRPFLSKRTFHERFCRNSLSNWALLPQGPWYRWKCNSFQTMNMIIAFKVIHCLQFLLIQVSTFKIICSLIHLIISYHQESYRHLDASHCLKEAIIGFNLYCRDGNKNSSYKNVSQLLSRISKWAIFSLYMLFTVLFTKINILFKIFLFLRDVQWRGLNLDELPYHMIEIKSKQSSRSIKFCNRFANSPIFSCYSYNDILIFSNERGERIF